MNFLSRCTAPLFCGAALVAAAFAAAAQSFPSKTVRIFMPTTGGSTVDIQVRVIGAKLAERLGATVVVEPRPGGNFIPAMQGVTLAPPDGHQIGMAVASMAIMPTSLKIDLFKDLMPLTRINAFRNVLVAPNSAPFATLPEFIKYAKANPGKLNYATVSLGGWTHLVGELFRREQGIDIVAVPYGGQVTPAVLGATVDAGITGQSEAIAFGKQARVLAVFGPRRDPRLPDVPASGEFGILTTDVDSWIGFVVRADTPRDLAQRLHAELVASMRAPDVAEAVRKLNFDLITDDTPEKFARKVAEDTALWARVIKEANLKF